jgi:hypothetical protein
MKGISSHQIHRRLGITYKTAVVHTHRIRTAMESADTPPMSSGGGYVESDEKSLFVLGFFCHPSGRERPQGAIAPIRPGAVYSIGTIR